MYIISLDLGSTNTKTIIENIKLKKIIYKNSRKSFDFDFTFNEIIKENNIQLENIEVIIATGTGASYIGNEYKGIKVYKVREFDAIATGGLSSFNKKEAIIVSIGTGTSFVYATQNENIHLGGTGLGGGTFSGLSGKLFPDKTFEQLLIMADNGNTKNVDLLIGDVSKEAIDNMDLNITAANFAATYKKSCDDDNVAAVLNLIVQTVAIMACLYKQTINKKNISIIFVGMVVKGVAFKKLLKEFSDFTKEEYLLETEPEFVVAKGALEFYKNNN